MNTEPDGSCPYSTGTKPPAPLTCREAEVAWWIAEGLENPKIAIRLGISRQTIKTHCHNILVKLGFHSRVQIGVWIKLRFHGVSSLMLAFTQAFEAVMG